QVRRPRDLFHEELCGRRGLQPAPRRRHGGEDGEADSEAGARPVGRGARSEARRRRDRMKTKVRTIGKVSVLDLSGKITIGEGDVILREEVNQLLEAGRENILLNLDRV